MLCGENKLLNGSMVHYLFLDNKLIEVKIEKFSFKNEANLMNYAIKKSLVILIDQIFQKKILEVTIFGTKMLKKLSMFLQILKVVI